MENKIINNDKVSINGPINFFKLKKDNKIIYLLCEVHEDISRQQECDDLYSINIDKYLKHVFKNSTETIDFMLETPEEFLNEDKKTYSDNNYNLKYIQKLRKMYIQNKNAEKNTRFHHIEIRYYNQLWELRELSENNMNNLWNNGLYDFYLIINNLKKIVEILINLLKITQKYRDNANIVDDKNTPIVEHIINKILNRYNDNKNKKIINNFYDKFCIDKIKFTIELINKNMTRYEEINKNNSDLYLQQYRTSIPFGEKGGKIMTYENNIPDYKNKLFEIKNEIEYILLLCINIGSAYVDSYFLRRFIDKDYVNNVIVYAGNFHIASYLWFLVKQCDFEIIEYNTINEKKTSEEFMEIIKKSTDMYDIYSYTEPIKFSQCVSMKPMNFK